MIETIRDFAKGIALQINNLQFIFDPEKFAIGGGISVQPLFLQLIREEVKKLYDLYFWDVPLAEITTCKFYNDANLIGAAYVHLKQTAHF